MHLDCLIHTRIFVTLWIYVTKFQIMYSIHLIPPSRIYLLQRFKSFKDLIASCIWHIYGLMYSTYYILYRWLILIVRNMIRLLQESIWGFFRKPKVIIFVLSQIRYCIKTHWHPNIFVFRYYILGSFIFNKLNVFWCLYKSK